MYDIRSTNYATGTQPSQTQTTPTGHHQEKHRSTGENKGRGTYTEHQARIVYLIQEVGSRFTKVGVTKNRASLERRLVNLQQGNPRELVVFDTWTFKEDGEAYNREQEILRGLKQYRSMPTSEWLNMYPNEVIHFVLTGELPQ